MSVVWKRPYSDSKQPKTLSECLEKGVYSEKPHKQTPWTIIICILTISFIFSYNNLRSGENINLSGTFIENITYIQEHNAKLINSLNEHFKNTTFDKKTKIYPVKAKTILLTEERGLNKSVAILVPYRNRESNLVEFLSGMNVFLHRQKLNYKIFIIEQFGTNKFNRGRLFNAGYKEIKKLGIWNCLIFHDVDLLPIDDRIPYSCPKWPLLFCSTIQGRKKGSFRTLFGGVSAMTTQQFERVNGYSNFYWGWGGEDNDLYWRMRNVGYPIRQYNKTFARYKSLHHSNQIKNRLRYSLLTTAKLRYQSDGLSSINYEVLFIKHYELYTHIMVNIYS